MFKKHWFFVILIVFFSLFASHKLFTPKFYTSHDGEGHIIRMIEFDASLRDGQFPVRITKRINYGLGYPFFNFNYPGIYYLGEGIHLVGLDYVTSFKVIMALSILIGGLTMYAFCFYHFRYLGAFTAGALYIFAPYRFLNMYVRGNVAESLGLALLPLMLFSTESLIRGKKWALGLLIATTALLLVSHNITAFVGIPFIIIYFVFRLLQYKEKKILVKKFVLSIFASFLLTAFFWLPVITESSQTKIVELTEDYKKFFPTIQEILYSPWGFGAFKQGEFPGKMSPQLGLVHSLVLLIALLLCCIRVLREKNFLQKHKVVLFFFGVVLISLFLVSPFSKFVWDIFYPLKLVQLPWRFVGFAVLGTSFLSAFIVSEFPWKKFQFVLVIALLVVALYTNRNHIRVNQYIDFQNPFMSSEIYGPSTTSNDEHMPKGAPRIFTTPNQNGDILEPTKGVSKRLEWKSNYHRFRIKIEEDGYFRDNISYFPGWMAKIDGSETPILYKQDAYKRLLVKVPRGEHTVEFSFSETPLRLISDTISIATLLVLISFIVRNIFFTFISFNLLVAFLSYSYIPKNGIFPYDLMIFKYNLPHFFASFANFDGLHYIRIASFGYVNFEQVFFPLYPLLIYICKYIFFNNPLLTGLIISYIAFFFVLKYFKDYLKLVIKNKKEINWAILFLLIFPTSFFYISVYTESLFFLLAILFFISIYKKNYILASIFAVLASLTRLQGIFLFTPFSLLLLQESGSLKNIFQKKKELFFIFPPFVGILFYSIYLWITFGDPFMYYHAQEQFGAERTAGGIVLLPQVLFRYFKIFFSAQFSTVYLVSAIEFFIFNLVFWTLVWELFVIVRNKHQIKNKLHELGLNLFSLSNIVLPTLTGTLSSTPRYALLSISFFIIIAKIRFIPIKIIIATVFGILHVIMLALFIRGYFVS